MKFGHAQKAKFQDGFQSDTAVLTFTFRFLSSPLFLLFLPHFFPQAGHLVGFILVGKVFRKAFNWVVEQDLQGNFRSMLHGFLPFFLMSLTELCSGMV